MIRTSIVSSALLFAPVALAVPTLDITAPAPGGCLGSGLPPIQGTVGGEPLIIPVEIPVTVTVRSAVDGDARIVASVDGEEVFAQTETLAAGQPREVALLLPGDAVVDGADRRITVRVEAADGQAADEVVVDIDRRPPDIVFTALSLADQNQCFAEPPALDFEVVDLVDDAPDIETRTEPLPGGCTVEQVITVRDHCAAGEVEGNAQVVRFVTVRPTPDIPRITFEGIAEGQRILEGELGYTTGVPDDCVVSRDATYVRDDDAPRPLGEGQYFGLPGDYTASVTLDICGHAPIAAERRFTVVERPVADPGGPYVTQQGDPLILSAADSVIPEDVVGPITEYAWDLDLDGFFDPDEGLGPEVPFDTDQPDGVYPIGLRIRTAGGFQYFGFSEVRIADVDPTCDAGGPYAAAQGELIRFDASASRPGSPNEPIVAYTWDFGDGEQRRAARPQTTHDYLEEGLYDVVLIAEDIDSACPEPAVVQVMIGDVEPIIEGIAATAEAIEGVPLRFTAGQTSAGSFAEPITGYRWDFGDGSPPVSGPALRGPEHTFVDDGPVRVCLEVTDVDSAVEQCIDLVVADLEPVARCSGPGFAVEGRAVTFDARGSRAGGAADPVARYVWDFGDGSPPVVVDDPARTRIEHAFIADGDLTVTLRVEDEDSAAEATCAIVIDDTAPEARFVVDAPGGVFEGRAITLDARGSRGGSAGDPIAEYHWIFGDGEELRGGPEVAVVQHAWPDQGDYTVELRLTDSDGSPASARNFVPVLNLAPSDVRIIGPDRAEVGQRVAFRVEYTDVAADPALITWRMGDGTVIEGADAVEHTYVEVPRIGRVTVRALVDDGDGGQTQVEQQVAVTAAGPSVDGPLVIDAVEGQPVEADWIVLSAPGANGLDGPVDVQIPTRPIGAVVEVRAGVPANARKLVHFEWTPGPDDGGEHRLLIVARAPSGLERVHPVVVRVAETTGAWLAAAGGDIQSGRVSLYRFDRVPGLDIQRFGLVAEIPVGGGAYDPTLGPGGRLHVAVPGSGALVSVSLDAAPRLVRKLPLAGRPTALAASPDHIWVGGADHLHAVAADDLERVASRRLDGADIAALAWIADGGAGEPVLLAADFGGDLLVLDPADALRERDPVITRHALGRGVRRIAVSGGRILLADTVDRAIIEVDPAGLLGETGDVVRDRWAVPFAPLDLALHDGAIWFTSSRGLERITPAGEAEVVDRETVAAVVSLPTTLYGTPALAVGGRDRVASRTPDGTTLDDARGGGGRRLLFFELPGR